MSQSKKVYLEAIRIIAILFVIFNHTDGFIYYTVTDNRLTWLYSIVLAVICRTAVPLFFMVSGALILAKEESLKTLFCKRVLRMVLVLTVVSVLYYLFDIARGRIPEAGISDFAGRILNNGIRDSFWFLYVYLIFLLSVPFLRKLAPGMSGTLIIYLICLKGISVWFDIEITCDYIYYGLMGYYLTHQGETAIRKIKGTTLWISAGILTALGVGIMQLMYRKTGSYEPLNLDVLIFLLTPVVWLLCRHVTERLPEESRLSALIPGLGSCVFGIYLFDNFVRWQFLPVYLYLSDKTIGVLANSIYVVLVFVTGGIYTWILKRIPLLGKFL